MNSIEVADATCWIHFFDVMSIGEWINTCLLVVAIAMLIWTGHSHRRQAQSADFSSYLQLTERYADAWRKFRCANDDNRDFEFGEVLNLIEGTCHLYKSRAIRGATREMIRDYLRDVLPKLFQNAYANERFTHGKISPDTYSYIYQFAEENRMDIPLGAH